MVVQLCLPVRRAQGGARRHSALAPPWRVGHPRQRAVTHLQEESWCLTNGPNLVDAHSKSGTVNLCGIWVEAPEGISHMARKTKLIGPCPCQSPHPQGGVSQSLSEDRF